MTLRFEKHSGVADEIFGRTFSENKTSYSWKSSPGIEEAENKRTKGLRQC